MIDNTGLEGFKKKITKDFVPTYAAELCIWPPFQLFNFTRIPVEHHLLAVNLMTVLDVSFLSWARSQVRGGGGGEGLPLPQLGHSQKLPGLVSAFFFITPTNLYPPILQLHIAYAPPPPISLPLLCFTLPCMRALQEDWVATILIAMNLRSPMKGAPS